ncbi:MAG: hypothetical protein V4772_03285 [Pseudomonadota bacterium]
MPCFTNWKVGAFMDELIRDEGRGARLARVACLLHLKAGEPMCEMNAADWALPVVDAGLPGGVLDFPELPALPDSDSESGHSDMWGWVA